MIIRNDNITEATIAGVPAFTPANFRNLGDWWNTSYGVQLSGTDVDSWVGINGNVFTPVHPEYKSIYESSDADFNGLPSISINPNGVDVGYTASVISGNTNKTYLLVVKMLTTSNENSIGLMNAIADPTMRAGVLSSNGMVWFLTDNTPGGSNNVTAISANAGQYVTTMVNYTKSLGTLNWYTSNTSSLPLTPTFISPNRTTSLSFDIFSFGWYIGIGVSAARYKIVEYIVINGTPTDEEITSFNSYVANTYGF